MPYWDSVDFRGLTVNDSANFATVSARPSTRYVAYGDSITQGAYVSNATKTYAARIGRAKGWEVVNMGFGGAGINGDDGTTIGGLHADVITVLMGYNNAAGGTTAANYRAGMAAFVGNVRRQEAKVPIYLISPLYTTTAGLPYC